MPKNDNETWEQYYARKPERRPIPAATALAAAPAQPQGESEAP